MMVEYSCAIELSRVVMVEYRSIDVMAESS